MRKVMGRPRVTGLSNGVPAEVQPEEWTMTVAFAGGGVPGPPGPQAALVGKTMRRGGPIRTDRYCDTRTRERANRIGLFP